jgi:manganese/iron transport system permease protein
MPFADYVTDPLQYEFMRRALVAVVLMGAVTGIVGSYIVLRGLSFIGDAMAHAIFPGVVVAFLLGQSIFVGALVFGAITAASIALIATNTRVKEDSAIGVMFAGSFALGVVLISSSRNYSRDLTHFLFGNVLGVTASDLYIAAAVGAVVVALVAVFYRELLIVSFDRAAAQAMGLPVLLIDLMLLVAISMTIVVSLRAVGNILVVAMLITPAAAARLLTDRLATMMLISAGIGVLSGVVGLYISFHNGVAAGGAIVLVATVIFGAAWLLAPEHGYLTARLLRRRLAAEAEPEARIVFESPEIQSPGGH